MRRTLVMLAILALAAAGCSKKTTTAGGAGGDSSTYCSLSQSLEDQSAKLDTGEAFTAPATAKEALGQLQQGVERVRPLVPAEIRTDYEALVAGLSKLIAGLERANYDFTKVDAETAALFDDKSLEAASDRIDAYNVRTCPNFRLAASATPTPS